MPRKLTKTEWIVKSQAKHGEGKYDYSQAIYINSESKVKIVCLTCGKAFEQSAIVHSRGQGCRNCHNKRLSQYMTYTLDDFITKSYSAHAVGKYDYSQVIYTSSKVEVKIICLRCNSEFWQLPELHWIGHGCKKCSKRETAKSLMLTKEQFLERAWAAHNPNDYDYSESVYMGAEKTIVIKCNRCDRKFEQLASNHMAGVGCPLCNISRGERLILSVVESLGIKFSREHSFDGCKSKRRLRFDFYLQDCNTCIEYHGVQHYEPVASWGGEKALKSCQRRDKIKAAFCKDNGIHLEVIPYWLDESQVRAIIARLAHVQLSLF